MTSLSKAVRAALLVSAASLLTLGVFATARGPSSGWDLWSWICFLILGFLLPAVFHSVAALRVVGPLLQATPFKHSVKEARGITFLLALSAILFISTLLLFVPLNPDMSAAERKSSFAPCAALLFVIFVFHVFARAQLNRESGTGDRSRGRPSGQGGRFDRVMDATDRFLMWARPVLWPPLMLGLGALLVLVFPGWGISPRSILDWSELRPFLGLGNGLWITAEFGLGEYLKPTQPLVNYLGHGLYVGALILSAVSPIWMVAHRFRPAALRASRACGPIAWVAEFLCAYSIIDFYLGWLGFLFGDKASGVWLWALFGLGVFYCGITFALAVPALLSRSSTPASRTLMLRMLILLYAPLLLSNSVLTGPFLESGWIDLRPIASFYFGLQFLCWGHMELYLGREAQRSDITPPSNT